MGRIRQQINWRSTLDSGEKIDVRAMNFPAGWTLKYRLRGESDWVRNWQAPVEEWSFLLDALRRRYQRRKASPEDLREVEEVISRMTAKLP